MDGSIRSWSTEYESNSCLPLHPIPSCLNDPRLNLVLPVKGTVHFQFQERESQHVGGGRSEAENVLPESMSFGQVLPRHENALLRRRTVSVLRNDRCRFGRMSQCRLF